MPEVNHTVARSMGEAAAASSRLIEKCVDHAVASLQEAESRTGDTAQRQQAAGAWRELLVRRRPWSARLPQLLAKALEAEANGSAQAEPPLSPSRFAALALVDDSEIARAIEASRLAQQLAATLERPLAELDALMSSALGLPGVQPERNPLRPEVYAQVLRRMMGEDDPDPAWPGLWLRHMAQPLGQGLEQLYRDQTHFLTLQRVHAASYRMVSAPGRPQQPGSAGAPGAPGAHESALAGALAAAAQTGFADFPAHAVEGSRLQQFLLRGEAQAHRPLGPGYYAQVDAELRTLEAQQEDAAYDARTARQHMHLPVVERPPRRVDTASPLPPEVWGQYSGSRERSLVHGRLKKQVREASQVFGLEVVRSLVNHVAEDPRLLGPVREAIVGLEPSLLRLAMVAPRFFGDAEHPGRLLVERVAERSFKYNDEFSVEFQGFFVPVGQCFSRLNQVEKFEDAAPFKAALDALQAGWAAQDALDEEQHRKVLDAVHFVERRQHAAEQIAGELSQREDLPGAPEAIREFLLGTWSLVVAHARLTQPRGGIDPGGHLAIVTDLLWSVDADRTLHDPARAFALIPHLLHQLRSGLEILGQQPGESDNFFRHLEALHRPVLKLRARHRHRDLGPPRVEIRDSADPDPQPREGLWMAPHEMRAAGFEDTHPSGNAPLSAAPEDSTDIVDALRPGAWVDLYSRQQWRRARLVWASDRGTLFMFVSHGGQPHTMTRRSIERLVREQMLRLVDGEAVVPRAMERLGRQSARMPLAA